MMGVLFDRGNESRPIVLGLDAREQGNGQGIIAEVSLNVDLEEAKGYRAELDDAIGKAETMQRQRERQAAGGPEGRPL